MIKIACIGTHGIGKSTFCYELAHYYKSQRLNVYLIHENVRFSPFPINDKMIAETAIWAYSTQVAKELECIPRKVDAIICDRSAYDTFIYAQHYNLTSKCMKYFETCAISWLESYDHFFFVRPDNQYDLFDDGVRSVDKTYQLAIDQRFESLVKRFRKKDYTEISSNDIFNGDKKRWMHSLGSLQV